MMDARLRLVYEFLDSDLYENALFVAERLHAVEPDNPSWLHLTALCYLRLGRVALAMDYSRERGIKGSHLGCSYVFAQACLKQKNYVDGITALRQAQPLWSGMHTSRSLESPVERHLANMGVETLDDHAASERFIPGAAAANRLLGKLYKASGDAKLAVDCQVKAVEANPFMWDSFTDLCDTGRLGLKSSPPSGGMLTKRPGIQLRVANVFKQRDTSANKTDHPKFSKVAPSEGNATNSLRGNPLRASQNQDAGLREAMQQPSFISRNDAHVGDENIDALEPRNVRSVSGDVHMTHSGIGAPALTKKRQRSVLDTQPADTAAAGRKENDVFSSRHAGSTLLAPQRRSARLLNQTNPSSGLSDRSAADPSNVKDPFKRLSKPRNPIRPTERKTSGMGRGPTAVRPPTTTNGRELKAAGPTSPTPAGRSGHSSKLASAAAAAAQLDQEKMQTLLALLSKLGSAYYLLSQFQPKACLEVLSSLPAEQQTTPWVLSKVGRAQYEMMAYREAKTTFQVLRRVAPSWLDDVEVYSTVLWHLKDDVELAFLGHELTDGHYLEPQTWCAMGNSFSLQRSHQEAIKCFRRAGQLEPQLAYSYSLLGHEHFEAEEYGEATTAFRKALQVDPRHYSAWVGLGRAQERLGQGDKALRYYRSGEKVNPNNAALLTYIARVRFKGTNEVCTRSC